MSPRPGRARVSAILVGAGIAFDEPTGFRGSRHVIARLLAALADPVSGASSETGIEVPLGAREAIKNERLELVLDLVSREIGRTAAIEPLLEVCALRPNFNHFALALLGIPVLTTNQDHLLEDASIQLRLALEVAHLHGRCENVDSVLTLLREYLAPWPDAVASHAAALVAESDLTVLGYSGRDRDVLAALAQTPPRRITWIVHDLRRLAPDVTHFQTHYRGEFSLVQGEAADWLGAQLTEGQRERAHLATWVSARARLAMPVGTPALDRSPMVDRQLAVGRLLERVGLLDQAAVVADRVLAASTGDDQVRGLMFRGRIRLQVPELRGAIHDYNRVIRLTPLGGPQTVDARQGIVEALRSSSRYAQARSEILKLRKELSREPQSEYRSRQLAWALNAQAGLDRMNGRLLEADRLYSAAAGTAKLARDIDSLLEVRTWQAETKVQLGRLRSALKLAAEVERDATQYARYFTDGWPAFVASEALTLAGRIPEALVFANTALARFERNSSAQGRPWALLQVAALSREDHVVARQALVAAARILGEAEDLGRPLTAAWLRWQLEDAELSRSRADHSSVRTAIGRFSRRLRAERRRGLTAHLLDLHRRLIELELVPRSQRLQGASAELALAYERIGAQYYVMRSVLSACDPRVCDQVRTRAGHRGYRGLKQAPADEAEYSPIYFV